MSKPRKFVNLIVACVVALALCRLVMLGEWGKLLEVMAGTIWLVDRVFDKDDKESEDKSDEKAD